MSNFRSMSIPPEEGLGQPSTIVKPPAAILALQDVPGWHVTFWYRDAVAHSQHADPVKALEQALVESAVKLAAAPSKYIACMLALVDAGGELVSAPTETVRAFILQLNKVGFVWFYDTERWHAVRSYKEIQ